MSSVLTPEQVEAVKDALTINKVKITFHAYRQIFHGLTDEQKAVHPEKSQGGARGGD